MKFAVFLFVVYLNNCSGQITNIEEQSVEKCSWLLNLINQIQHDTGGSMDIVIDPSMDAIVEQHFDYLRSKVGVLDVTKYEKSISTLIKRNALFLFDGTAPKYLLKSLKAFSYRAPQLKKLAEITSQYFVIVVNSQITKEHEIVMSSTTSCHIILVDISTSYPQFFRLTSMDKRRLNIVGNSSLATVLSYHHDWSQYEVRIQAVTNRHPYSKLVNGSFIGLDIEVCRAIFESSRIRYRFVAAPSNMNFSMYRSRVENNLANRRIDMIISLAIFANKFAEELPIYDKIGLCLVLPKSLNRNVVYHLVHPFQLNIWILIFIVLLLDIILSQFFANIFPHNLVLILLFGDPIPGHQQSRWTRFYCFACAVLLFVLSEAYLVKVIHYMTVTRYTPDMRTVDEVLDSEVQLKVPFGTKQQIYAGEAILDSHRNMLQRMIEVENFRYDQLDSNYGYLVPSSYGQTVLERHVRQELERFGHREAKRKFYLLEEMLDWNWRSYAVANHFTFYGRLRLLTSWINEAGLWDKWMIDFGKKTTSDRQRYVLWDENDILGLEDIAAVWYLIGTGWIVAGGVFLLEWIWFRMKKLLCHLKRS